MPQIDFDPVHVINQRQEFDRLKLRKDERARIVLLENPTFAFVHELRAPKIVDGQAVKVMKDSKRNTGEKYMDWDMDFIGRPHCLGDYGVIADKGLDETNCPACARSKEVDGEVRPPERRFAMNIIQYKLRADGQLVTPFSCEALVWAFSEGKYSKLVQVAQEYEGLIGRDLVLGPCTNEGYQNFEIMPSPKAVWQLDDSIRNTVIATYQGNKVADLEVACGRKVERRWMQEDLDKVAQRWRVANGLAPTSAPTNLPTNAGNGNGHADNLGTGADLAQGMADLLAASTANNSANNSANNTAPTPAQYPGLTPGAADVPRVDFSDLPAVPAAPVSTPPAPAGGLDFAALLHGGAPTAAAAPPAAPQPQPAPQPAPVPVPVPVPDPIPAPAAPAGAMDFAALLKDLQS